MPTPKELALKLAATVRGALRSDGWSNAVTGLGTYERDKVMSARVSRTAAVGDDELQELYETDDIAGVLAETEAEDMLRDGFSLSVTPDDPDVTQAVQSECERLELVQKFTDALVWEFVYGGSAIVLGLDDGLPPEAPLDIERLRGVRFANVLDRRDLTPQYWYTDPRAPKYGRPAVYRVVYTPRGQGTLEEVAKAAATNRVMSVHESRMIVFPGSRISPRSRTYTPGWGVSRLARLYGPMRAFASNWQAVENLMVDASQGVFKLRGLMDAISQKGSDVVETRMRLLDMSRSVARAIVVDADSEEFERKDTTLSGLPDLLDRTAQRLAAGARMPVTKLMGMSPSGLNATGESDTRNWYDALAAQRTKRLEPRVRRVLQLLLRSKDGPTRGVEPEKWSVHFPPLWQPTQLEAAQASATQTQSDVALIQAGVIVPEEVAMRRAQELGIEVDSREAELALLRDPTAGVTNTSPSSATTPPVASGDPTPPTPAGGAEKAADTALNGAQVSSLLEVVASVARGALPRETGVEIITAAFPVSREQAEKIMGTVGRGFVSSEVAPSAQPAAPAVTGAE
jgi:phage-related protein (TIGR01555 family)